MGSLWSTYFSFYTVSIGASGAIFGLVGADITYLIYNWHEIPQNGMELCILSVILLMNFLFGIGSGVDNYAHLGGLIGGMLLGLGLTPPLIRRVKEKYYRGGATAGFCGLALLFILLIWKGQPQNG